MYHGGGLTDVFVYGTLPDCKTRGRIIGRHVGIRDAVLECHPRSSIVIDGQTYDIIGPDLEGTVKGAVMSVTPGELSALDEYETPAYSRMRVTLRDGGTAWTYASPQ